MREIVLDTETTGLDPQSGHRIVEIGCIELKNHLPTGRFFHKYINPERDMPAEAFAVHGLSEEFLRNHPLMKDLVDEFLDFIENDTLIIHNAGFDIKFLNAELTLVTRPLLEMIRVIDTLQMARKKFPGSPASLDALCRRFQVDNTNREKHGALLDATLLAEVYLHLIGGRQPNLSLQKEKRQTSSQENVERVFRSPRDFPIQKEDEFTHKAFLQNMKAPLWNKP